VKNVLAALVPAVVVTKTLAVPADPAGVVTVIEVALFTTRLVAGLPPMVTAVAPVKSVPVMVMVVPPAVDPAEGEMLATEGAGVIYSKAPMLGAVEERVTPR